jgi:hypothetical protein
MYRALRIGPVMTEFGLPVTEGPVPRKIPSAILFANVGKYVPYAATAVCGGHVVLIPRYSTAIKDQPTSSLTMTIDDFSLGLYQFVIVLLNFHHQKARARPQN